MYELFLLILLAIGQESLVALIYTNSVFTIELVSENCQFSYTTGTIGTQNAYALRDSVGCVYMWCGYGSTSDTYSQSTPFFCIIVGFEQDGIANTIFRNINILYVMEIFIILAIIIIPIAIFGYLKQKKETNAKEESLTRKYGAITKKIEDMSPDMECQYIYVFEQAEIIVIKDKEYRFNSILDFSINGAQSYKVTTSTSSMIGRGVVGGVLFGGIGALAGATTASKNVKPKDFRIAITTKDIRTPVIEYKTKYETVANELVSLLKIIIDRTK